MDRRPWCPGSRGWPDGTKYPHNANSPGFATCGRCGKRVSCIRSPNAYMPVGMLRAHRLGNRVPTTSGATLP